LELSGSTAQNLIVNSTGSASYMQFANSGGITGYIGSSGGINSGGGNNALGLRSQNEMVFATGGSTERMRLDASGNLGLGVTPSAWGGVYKAFQVGNGAALFGQNNSASVVHVGGNVFYNVDNQARYIGTEAAQMYRGFLGAHEWFTAPSGTAGNAISFSQVMTLDPSGNLVVGGTTASAKIHGIASSVGGTTYALMTDNASGGAGVNVAGIAFANSGAIKSSITSAVYGNDYIAFNVGGSGTTERARIDASGNLIQTVNTTAATLATNGTLTFSIVDNSTLRISVRGSDGTTRTATVALT
jgi:hypothetical protein